ncbi:MAG TPA: PhzF family phenazine biosynthesis protein [Bryobacteraceae bacterium]|nr:PhzF family phenazine biosynthesis protein [Bryobacteraceae bacterium]
MPDSSTRTYRIVDVFTRHRREGNPLAVFPDGEGLDTSTMQSVAGELNLSETVFILPSTRPDCAARLRIFTPTREMQFAGHPTVGASFVLLDEGIVPKDSERFVLEEGVGPVPIRVEPGDRPLIWLTTPAIHDGPVFDRALCAEVLCLDAADLLTPTPQLLTAGNPAIFIALKDAAAVDRAALDAAGMRKLRGNYADPLCVFVFTPTPEGAYSRMFAPEYGIIEDPATGSVTGPLAAYMLRHNLVSGAPGTRFISEQGTKMGRRSLLHVQLHGERGSTGIDIGGYVTPLVRAIMDF